MRLPYLSALPDIRVNHERQFHHISIDFCGRVFRRYGSKDEEIIHSIDYLYIGILHFQLVPDLSVI